MLITKNGIRRGLDLAEGHKSDKFDYNPVIDKEGKKDVNELEFAAAVNCLNIEYGRIVLDQHLDAYHFEQLEGCEELLEEAYQIHSRALPQDIVELANPCPVHIDLAIDSYFMSQVNADKVRYESDAFRYLGLNMKSVAIFELLCMVPSSPFSRRYYKSVRCLQ